MQYTLQKLGQLLYYVSTGLYYPATVPKSARDTDHYSTARRTRSHYRNLYSLERLDPEPLYRCMNPL